MTEIATQGVDGIVVPREDADALAGAAMVLLSDAALRTRLSLAAIKRVDRDLSQAAVAAKIARALRQAVSERRGSDEPPATELEDDNRG